MAYEYHTKVPSGLKVLLLNATADPGGRFVQVSAGKVRNDLPRPNLVPPGTALAFRCKFCLAERRCVYRTFESKSDVENLSVWLISY
jgi:hypothetical protein